MQQADVTNRYRRLEDEMGFWGEATEPSQVYHRNEQLSYICKTPKITIRVDRGRRWRLFRNRFFIVRRVEEQRWSRPRRGVFAAHIEAFGAGFFRTR